MALTIKDGAGSTTSLKTTLTGSDHMPHHIVQAVSGTVAITSSAANPAFITGSVSVATTYTNNSVTALYVRVTASAEDYVKVATDVDKYAYPGGTLGALVTKITASSGDPVYVTSSNIYPVYVSSSEDRPVFVVSNAGKPVYVSSSAGNWVQVTASHSFPVAVSSNESKPVFVVNNVGNSVFVTSSDSTPVITKAKLASSVTRNKFTNGGGSPQIDWASTGSSNISGTFILADSSSARVGLLFANNTSRDLYVAIGNGSYSTTNGFLLSGTGSAPNDYSFILYPSGTYSADPSFANAKHSGFFVSASNIDVTVTVVTTE
jgi:hypothetical protein